MANQRDAVPQESTAAIATAADKAAALVQQASQKIAKNDFRGAGAILEQACLLQPRSIDLLNSTAMTWLQAGDPAHAEEFLGRALRFAPNNLDVLHNLALVRTSQGKFEAAAECLHRIIMLAPLEAAAYNDLAIIEEQGGNLTGALNSFGRGARLKSAGKKLYTNYMEFALRNPSLANFEAIREEYRDRWGEDLVLSDWEKHFKQEKQGVTNAPAETKVQRAKIAVFASFRTFIDPVIDRLKSQHELRIFEKGTEAEMKSLLEWCDLAWFEWCDQLVIAATKLPKTCKIVCRLHSYEVFSDMPRHVDWNKIDHLVLVSDAVKDLLSYNFSVPTPTTVIHNGVDLEKFTMPAQKPAGKKICSIGYINYKKNPALLLYSFKAIHDYDPNYTFHLAGEHQDARYQVYFAHLLPKLNIPVSFDGWVDDISGYLRDKDFVISTSLFESFHYSIAEGMASGVLPLIHDWLGAEQIYPKRYVFTTPDDSVRLLRELERGDRPALQKECRQFIAERYDNRRQLQKIENLISQVLKGNSDEVQHG